MNNLCSLSDKVVFANGVETGARLGILKFHQSECNRLDYNEINEGFVLVIWNVMLQEVHFGDHE